MNEDKIIIYRTEDDAVSVYVRFDEDTVWLTLDQMAELFGRDKSTISRHIRNIYQEGELSQDATVAKFATVQQEGLLYSKFSACLLFSSAFLKTHITTTQNTCFTELMKGRI